MKAFQLRYEVEGFEGNECTATIIESDQSAAMQRLKNVVASRGQKVVRVTGSTVTVENVHATKETEREILEEIRYLIESAGEGSYLSMAFDGCLEDAEKNIEEDAGYSMKCRYLTAQKDANYYKRAAETFSKDSERYQAELAGARSQMLSEDDLVTLHSLLLHELDVVQNQMDVAAQDIVQLADDPDTDDFKTAVRAHREARDNLHRYRATKERLTKIACGK